MEICVPSLQDLDELQLSHLWHFHVRMTSAATKGNVQSGEKLRFVFLTFWASSDCNKLDLDELECLIKTEAGEQKSRGEEPAVSTPRGTADAFHGDRRVAAFQRRPRTRSGSRVRGSSGVSWFL